MCTPRGIRDKWAPNFKTERIRVGGANPLLLNKFENKIQKIISKNFEFKITFTLRNKIKTN